MLEATVPILLTWQNFYVIIGSAAATLTGLMFVVVTLTANRQLQGAGSGVAAFGTPTVVHFCVALLIAAIFSAPWPMLWNVSLLLGLVGLGGIVYILIIVQRMRHKANSNYKPVLEDWLWHMVLPLVAYTAFIVSAIALLNNSALPLFFVSAATVLLLFIGIHNSWDTVTYIAVQPSQQEHKSEAQRDSTGVR